MLLGLLLIVLPIAATVAAAVRARSLALGAFAASMVVLYGLRGVGLAFSVDRPYPDAMFRTTDIDTVLLRFGALLTLFIVAFLFAYFVQTEASTLIARAFPLPRKDIPLRLLIAVTLVFTALAGLIALRQIATFGSVAAAIYAAKAERVSGEGILRIPGTLALLLSCAVFYAASRATASLVSARLLRLLMAGCLLISALSAFVWGSRQFPLLALAYLVGGPTIRAFRQARRGWIVRSVILISLILGAGFGLRLYRDDAIGGRTAVSEAEGHLFRQLTLSMNGQTLDSALLAVRDWPLRFDFLGWKLFVDGLWSGVPPQLRPLGMKLDTVGAVFHRFYDPSARSGWPVGAPVEWYLSHGWWGVLLGGFLSGLIYRAMSLGLARSPLPEIATVSVLILSLVVFPLGLSAASANRYVVHALPFTLVLAAVAILMRRNEASDGGRLRSEAARSIGANAPTARQRGQAPIVAARKRRISEMKPSRTR